MGVKIEITAEGAGEQEVLDRLASQRRDFLGDLNIESVLLEQLGGVWRGRCVIVDRPADDIPF
jgi:hypothetical protein